MPRLQLPLVAAALLAGASALPAQATPAAQPAAAALRLQPSGRATTAVELTGPQGTEPRTIRIDYGQPHLRGRTLHQAGLVPYDMPWRTGANASTMLETDVDLVVGGQNVPRGRYVVWTLPSASGWKLMLARPDESGSMQSMMRYDASREVARVDLRTSTTAAPVESFTITLVPGTQPGAPRGELRMAWGTTQLATDWSVR